MSSPFGGSSRPSREALLVLGLLAALAAFLWPTLSLPYLGDDTFNAYIDGWIGYERLSLGEAFRQFFTITGTNVGRFYPIYPLLIFFDFHAIHDRAILKALVLGAILLNALTFYALVRLRSPRLALPFLAILPATLQLRYFHDPILQFSLHMQLGFEFALIGMIGVVAFERTRRITHAIFGVVAYLFAALTYEATYAFVPIYIALGTVSIANARTRAWICGAYALVPIGCSAVAIAIRSHVPVDPSSPYAVHADPTAIARTIVIQCLGAIPLSYSLFNPAGVLPRLGSLAHMLSCWIFAAISFVLVLLAFGSADYAEGGRRDSRAIALGAALVVLSAVLIALSARWQRELVFGLAYTPVYFEAFGVSLVLAAAGIALVRRFRGVPLAPICAILIAFAIGVTRAANDVVLTRYVAWSSIVPRALDSGILANARVGDAVYLDDSYPAHAMLAGGTWDARYYLFAHTGKRLVPKSLASVPIAAAPNSFALEGYKRDFTTGRVVAGPIAQIAPVAGANVVLVRSARWFDAGPGPSQATVGEFRSRCGPVPLENVRDDIASALLVRFDSAFSFLERDGSVPFRWASGSGRISIDNPSDISRRAVVSLTLRPANEPSHVRIDVGNRTILRRTTEADVAIVTNVEVRGGATVAIDVDADGPPVAGNPGGRILRFEVRDVRVVESACAPTN